MCDVLYAIYQNVYKEQFEYRQLNSRKKLQEAVYLLNNMGIGIGDYGFLWSIDGVYSLALDFDAKLNRDNTQQKVNFSPMALDSFSKLNKLSEVDTDYSIVQWMCCLATAHYFKNVLQYNVDELPQILKERCNDFYNVETNLQAVHLISGIGE